MDRIALSILRGAWRISNRMLLTFLRAALIGLSLLFIVLIVAEVIFRYFLNMPLMFVEELCVYFIFWMYMLGAAYGTYERTHIKGEVIGLFFKNPKIIVSFRIAISLFCFALSCLMTIWGYQSFVWDLDAHTETQMLFLPLAYARLSIFVGFALMSIYFLVESVDVFRAFLTKRSLNSL